MALPVVDSGPLADHYCKKYATIVAIAGAAIEILASVYMPAADVVADC